MKLKQRPCVGRGGPPGSGLARGKRVASLNSKSGRKAYNRLIMYEKKRRRKHYYSELNR